MKLVFVTNIWNHYQASLCEAFVGQLGAANFRMVLCESMHAERRVLGWTDASGGREWVIGPPQKPEQLQEYSQFVDEADVAIMGDSPRWMQWRRAKTGKLTFMAMERLWKMPLFWWRFLNPRFLASVQQFRMTANLPNVHLLAIGRYTADDVKAIRAFGDRIWTWGYFADMPVELPPRQPKSKLRIFWAGRMIRWKRVDMLIEACAAMRGGPAFHLDIVGGGPERHRLGLLVRNRDLAQFVTFHGPLPPDEVRRLMRASDVYVMPSDRNEGWGVVANEAIAEGCVLVANEQAGASRVLIEDRKTGFLFPDDDVSTLSGILRELALHPELLEQARKSAWRSVCDLWSPQAAVRRFTDLMNGLSGADTIPTFCSGPCRSEGVVVSS